MKKGKRAALILLAAVCVLAVMISFTAGMTHLLKMPRPEWCYRIFDNISELDKLETYTAEDCEDPYLGNADPAEHYCKMIYCEGEEYLVAGYTFDSLLDTLRFYKRNIWNERLNPLIENGAIEPSFWNEGFDSETLVGWRTKLAYYYETNILLIESRTANSEQMEAFQRWLAESFTLEIPGLKSELEMFEESTSDEKTEKACA